jgi:hypothetical protein
MRPFRLASLTATLTAVTVWVGVAQASPITDTVTFSASGFQPLVGPQTGGPQDPATGSFTFTYDTTDINSNVPIAPSEVSLTINGFIYTTANTGVLVEIIPNVTPNGRLDFFGSLNGSALSGTGFSDDFHLGIDDFLVGTPTFTFFEYEVLSSASLFSTGVGSATVAPATPVPEPGTPGLLFNAILAALGVWRRTSVSNAKAQSHKGWMLNVFFGEIRPSALS